MPGSPSADTSFMQEPARQRHVLGVLDEQQSRVRVSIMTEQTCVGRVSRQSENATAPAADSSLRSESSCRRGRLIVAIGRRALLSPRSRARDLGDKSGESIAARCSASRSRGETPRSGARAPVACLGSSKPPRGAQAVDEAGVTTEPLSSSSPRRSVRLRVGVPPTVSSASHAPLCYLTLHRDRFPSRPPLDLAPSFIGPGCITGSPVRTANRASVSPHTRVYS